ncbi:hypothetical protein uvFWCGRAMDCOMC440_015 [Freshwater phage uvFW-CGR-AMD-COM-C440]|nr:hypothetical protein uvFWCGRAMDCOMC440_015 [Freshwater phage uvFW-CGR-AMD-COM-C440]
MTNKQTCIATPLTADEDNIGMSYDTEVCGKQGNLMLKYELRGSYYGTIVLCEEHSDNVWGEITRLIDVDDF